MINRVVVAVDVAPVVVDAVAAVAVDVVADVVDAVEEMKPPPRMLKVHSTTTIR